MESLNAATELAIGQGIQLPSAVHFVQTPHHRGRHKVPASEEVPPHLKPMVTNAFIRCGFHIGQTKGLAIYCYHNMPVRKGYGAMTFVPFHYEVEE